MIGCINFAEDFVVSGTASQNLFGLCEALWRPGMDETELFETISQVLMSAMDRDAYSGWGAVVYIITKDKTVKRTLKTRMVCSFYFYFL